VKKRAVIKLEKIAKNVILAFLEKLFRIEKKKLRGGGKKARE